MNKDDSGKFISAQGASPRVAGLCGELQEERVLFDLADPVVLDTLRADAMRMAASMDDPAEEPPMLWSGVPWPRGEDPLRSDYCLSISVGGSKMVALLLRVEGGEAVSAPPARSCEVRTLRVLQRPTPAPRQTPAIRPMVFP